MNAAVFRLISYLRAWMRFRFRVHVVDFHNPLILYIKIMPGIKPLLSPAAVAAILGIQPHQLAMWRARRIGIPWIKIGEGRVGAVRYHPDDVDAFLKAHRRQIQRLAHVTTDGISKRARKAAEPPPSFSAPPDQESS